MQVHHPAHLFDDARKTSELANDTLAEKGKENRRNARV
jgi:hypothetical protein